MPTGCINKTTEYAWIEYSGIFCSSHGTAVPCILKKTSSNPSRATGSRKILYYFIVLLTGSGSLVTCTPFGVNTHRLLVRGNRIPYEEAEEILEQQPIIEEPTSTWEEKYMDGIITGICIVLILALLAGVVWYIRRK